MAAIEVRVEWKGTAAQLQHGTCDRCRRNHDADGRPLIVARRARSRLFVCLDCFAGGASASERRAA